MRMITINEFTFKCNICSQKIVYRVIKVDDIFKCLDLIKKHWRFVEVFGTNYHTCKDCNIFNFDDRKDINYFEFDMFNLNYLELKKNDEISKLKVYF